MAHLWQSGREMRVVSNEQEGRHTRSSGPGAALLSRACERARRGIAAAFAVLAIMLVAGAASAETRIALVIGNSAYQKAPLANPKNDARVIGQSLGTAGFRVKLLVDADQQTMRQAILAFGRELRVGDSVGVFYFAGHGVQVDGQNFLIPIGADISDASEVPLLGVSLSELLLTMEGAQSRLNIAILDACRDNPFPSRTRSLVRGLAPVQSPAGTFIAFATGPGEVALDGEGGHSPYSKALAAHIPVVGIPLEETFRRTRRQVLQATANKQVPWEHSSLTGEFFFRPKMAEPEAREKPVARVDERHLAELAAWEQIKSSQDKSLLERHVATYPDGIFSELVMLRLERLRQAPSPWASVITGSTVTAATRSDQVDAYEQGLKAESRAGDAAGYLEAAKLYRKAADTGLAAAMYRLARLHDHGLGVKRDTQEAARWYRRAADLGHAPAMSALGTMFEFGQGVTLDLAEALRLYRLAAEQGDGAGMTSLGFLFGQGKGVARDQKAARRWYGLAIERGEPRAMFNLALMHLRGQGGVSDLAEAVRLLQSAAERGHAGAKRELAFLYDEGRGVARNPDLAAEHLLAALAGGHKDAENELLRQPGAWSYSTRRAIQRNLAKRGLYRGAAHGIFNQSTKSALRKVASAN